MKTWLTSDTHFFHANIIKYCNRPFASVEEMNETMIRNRNQVVSPGDLVWHLGDFSMGKRSRVSEIRQQLNGRIHLVRGNHDYGKDTLSCFDEVHKSVVTELDGILVEMVHNPRAVQGHGVLALCGHVHDLWVTKVKGTEAPEYAASDHIDPSFTVPVDIFNVGMDIRGFRPVSLAEVLNQTATV